jgi:hypothetical protein
MQAGAVEGQECRPWTELDFSYPPRLHGHAESPLRFHDSQAVGKQWFTFRHVSIGTRRLFLPVIVTNATLYTCTFDAEKVSMADGGLSHGDFQEVPVVRFRKGLAMGQIGSGNASDFADAYRQQQRTLLIVNSSSLASTLKQLELREEGERSLWNAYERLVPATAVD